MKAAKPISPWKKYGLCVGGTWGVWLILMLVIYLLALGPQNTLMARLSKDFVAANEEVSLAQKVSRPETRKYIEEELQAAGRKTSYFVVAPDNTAGLILQIGQLAAKHQLQNFSTRVISSPSGKKSNKLKVSEAWLELDCSGTFPQIASFINSLERNEPVVFIENVKIQRSVREEDLPSASIQIAYLTGKPDTKPAAAESKRKDSKQ